MTKRFELPLPPAEVPVVPVLTKVEKVKTVPIPLPPPLTQLQKVKSSFEAARGERIVSLTPPPLTVLKSPVSIQVDEEESEDYQNYEDEDEEEQENEEYYQHWSPSDPVWQNPVEPILSPLEPVKALGWPNPSFASENASQAPQIAPNRPSIASLFAPDENLGKSVSTVGQTLQQSEVNQARYYLTFFKFADERHSNLIDITHVTYIPPGITPKSWFETKIRERYAAAEHGPIAEAKATGNAYVRESIASEDVRDRNSFVFGMEVLGAIPGTAVMRAKIGEYWVLGFKDVPIQI